MNLLKYTLVCVLTLVLIGSAGYLLASTGIKSKPGYAKLSMPNWFETDTKVALNLGPRGLKPARWVINSLVRASGSEFELSEKLFITMLQDIEGLQLRVYEVDSNRDVFEKAINESVTTLKQDNWQTLISVREDDKHIVVMQAEDQGLISGLSVLASTPENAVFVNLVGQIDPESIALIAESLNQ